jgi:hypothetical protein
MASRKRRRTRTLLRTALEGGAAGMAAALAISLAERELLPRLAGGTRHRSRVDDVAAAGLARVGLDLGDRGRIAAGIGTQLAYGAALGAAYAVLREQARDSRAGRVLLDGALTFAGSLVFPDRPTPVRRGRRFPFRRKVVAPVNPAATFGRVTAMALGALR